MEEGRDTVRPIVFEGKRDRLDTGIDFRGLMRKEKSFLDSVFAEDFGNNTHIDIAVFAGRASGMGTIKQ